MHAPLSVLLIAGSPARHARSSSMLEAVQERLLLNADITIERISIRDLPPQALVLGQAAHPRIATALWKLAQAQAVVVATPVCRAACSGLLKTFLDLLPEKAFQGKTVLPLASDSSGAHMLALDYALRPVLQALLPRHILAGVYATDDDITRAPADNFELSPPLIARLDAAVDALLTESHRRAGPYPHTPWMASRLPLVRASSARCPA